MKSRIFYFSGTGNSLFVAKELAKRIDNTELAPIPLFLQENQFISYAERIGFVFPCHFGDIPLIVNDFLEKLEIPNVIYTFAVVTRGGGKGYTLENLNRRLEVKNSKLDYGVSFHMQMTYIPAFYYSFMFFSEKEERRNEKNVIKKIEDISHEVSQSRVKIEWSNPFEYAVEKALNRNVLKFSRNYLDKYFATFETCTACGTCK